MKKLLLLFSMALITATASADAPFTKDTTLTAQEIKARKLTPDIMLKMGRLSNTQLSPSGTQILYTVNYQSVSQNTSYTGLWVMDKDGGNARRITGYDIKVGEPRWNSDGTKIYFSAAGEVYSITPDGSQQKVLTNTEGKVRGFGVSSDDQKIWVAMDTKIQNVTSAEFYPELKESNALVYDDLMARHWDVWEDGKYSHIYVGFIEDNGEKFDQFEDIMKGEPYDSPGAPYFSNGEVSWTADSKAIAYTCRKLLGYEYAISTNTDIYLYNIESKTTKNLTEGMPGYDKYPAFSPDGKWMAWASMERAGNESDKSRLFVLNLETGEKRDLTKNFEHGAAAIHWSDDSKTVYFISGISATHQICSVELGKGEVKVLTEGLHDYVSFSLVGKDIVGEKTTLSMASEIFSVDLRSGKDKQLSFVNKNIYDNVDMGRVEERWVTTTDGKKMLTWVVLPPNAKTDGSVKYPTLLYCQGGPQSVVSQFWSYRWNFQVMAAQGYVVVAPNRRGLPSFGQEWLDQISGDYSGQNIADYLSAIDDVATESYVDKSNLGCVGASYGGYSVFYLAGKHEGRFKSFISHCGIFNFTSMYGSTEELWFVNRDYGGPYWDKSNYIAQNSYANSPHHFVSNWDTPMLIITGLNDYRIPYTQSLEAFTAARALGIPSRLLAFEDEAHQVFGPQNAIVWHREFFAWLDKYLQ